jgi:hypothetical protein
MVANFVSKALITFDVATFTVIALVIYFPFRSVGWLISIT